MLAVSFPLEQGVWKDLIGEINEATCSGVLGRKMTSEAAENFRLAEVHLSDKQAEKWKNISY